MPAASLRSLNILSIRSKGIHLSRRQQWGIIPPILRNRLSDHGYATVVESTEKDAALTDPVSFNLPQRYWNQDLENEQFAAWLNCLQKEYRLHPDFGIAQTWDKIKTSGDSLPMQGPVADELWRLLLQDMNLHEELFQYALGVKAASGIMFDRLYEFLIGRLLVKAVSGSEEHPLVLKWHNLFLQDYFIRPGALNVLASAAKASRSNLQLFRQIYRRGACNPREGIYDVIVPELCKLKEWRLALDWHFFLYSQGDIPKGSSFFKTAFGKKPSLEEALSEFILTSSGRALQPATATKKPWTPVEDTELPLDLDEEGMNRSGESDHDSSRRHAPLSDDFCARLLATRSLTVPTVIKQLQIFEHCKLGPIALRELMARATNTDEASEYLKLFEDADISIGFSMYPRVVNHFVASDQYDLLDNLIQSDLHPDTLSDRELQQKLLEYYVSRNEHLNAKRTIEILKVLDSRTSNASSNATTSETLTPSLSSLQQSDSMHYFRLLCASQQRPDLQILVDDMITQGLPLTNEQLSLIAKSWLRTRNIIRNGKYVRQFVPNLSLRLLKSGQILNHRLWTQMLSILGFLGKERDIFSVFNFFVRQHYTRPLKAQLFNRLGAESDRCTSPIEEISAYLAENNAESLAAKFCLPHLTGGIVAWGFRSAIPRLLGSNVHRTSPAPVFLSGLRFCSELMRQGFSASRTVVASTLRRRLLRLYGIEPLLGRKNLVIKRYNYFTLEELLYHIEQLWPGSRLFPEIYNNPDVAPVEYWSEKIPWTTPNAIPTEVSGNDPLNPSLLESSNAWAQTHNSPWVYKHYHELSEKFGGSLLDGLLLETTKPEAPPLSQDERLRRRLELRYVILGKTPGGSLTEEGGTVSQQAWDDYIRNSAFVADRLLIHRGRCQISQNE